jgi:hypothetical protein
MHLYICNRTSSTIRKLFLVRFFHMPAELVSHRREQLVLKVRFAARAKALIERRREDRHRHGLIYGGLDGPSPFP